MPEPVCSQLSRVLVSFTIEADDEFEHRVPHRTTRHGTREKAQDDGEAPWLVSLLMWQTCMRFIPAEGVPVRSYARSAWWLTRKGIGTIVRRMGGWWGYLTVEDRAPGSAKGDRVVRPTAGGLRALEAWGPLSDDIEARWQERFGAGQLAALRTALEALVDQFEQPLPDCLPIYDVALDRRAPEQPQIAASLPGLLSQAILRFQLDFDAIHPVPLSLCGNVLRVLDRDGARVKDLAARTGLADDGVEAGLRVLERRGLVEVRSDPGRSRFRIATLTGDGVIQQRAAAEVLDLVQARWRKNYGPHLVASLHDALASIAGSAEDSDGPLWKGLYRYPDGWRSSLPRPLTLPHHPVTSHRGGYLDGA